jgi:hypothetical protein
MMKIFKRDVSNKEFADERFIDRHDRNSSRLFENLQVHNCYFESCSLSLASNPKRRSTVRQVEMGACEARGCIVFTPILQVIHIMDLKIHGLLQCWGAAFDRVTLTGRISGFMISPVIDPMHIDSEAQRMFNQANKTFYEEVDWALDISGAEFTGEVDIRGIPARLIRRDPETQAVVTREKALEGTWRELDLSETYWPTSIEYLLKHNESDTVLIAPKRSPKFGVLMQGLDRLREAGVAE